MSALSGLQWYGWLVLVVALWSAIDVACELTRVRAGHTTSVSFVAVAIAAPAWALLLYLVTP